MEERNINVHQASIFRLQAMVEQLLRLQCEMYAHMANKEFKEIYDLVWREVDSSTKELIQMHSTPGGDLDPGQN
jgi:hypothetical protein